MFGRLNASTTLSLHGISSSVIQLGHSQTSNNLINDPASRGTCKLESKWNFVSRNPNIDRSQSTVAEQAHQWLWRI
ncbi:two-component response regulator ORR22-like [Gossypium australe]|uniref:Two-component response regulator ORR22-like n=1 Tax=Gossypium australe TaxID=47621 RepID=A0A5B6USA2_9ROSI|nr:two-component response regulator ORR22-like [Gossypium australe]